MPDAVYDRFWVFEALVSLLLARLALHLLPFKSIQWYLKRPTGKPELAGVERERVRKAVRRAILQAVKLLPGKTVCFPRALAAQAMLRRRRIGTSLYYGAMTHRDKGLITHVWVLDGNEGVIGHRVSDGYKIIARYPNT
jgi:hypothetical protein